MEAMPTVWDLGPVRRGYLYVGDIFIGAVEEARLTARPVDPQAGDESGFVELSVLVGQRQLARMNALDGPIGDAARWRFKIAGPDPWSYPECVIEQGRGVLTDEDHLVIRSEWDRVEEGGRPWSIKPSSPPPDVAVLSRLDIGL